MPAVTAKATIITNTLTTAVSITFRALPALFFMPKYSFMIKMTVIFSVKNRVPETDALFYMSRAFKTDLKVSNNRKSPRKTKAIFR